MYGHICLPRPRCVRTPLGLSAVPPSPGDRVNIGGPRTIGRLLGNETHLDMSRFTRHDGWRRRRVEASETAGPYPQTPWPLD